VYVTKQRNCVNNWEKHENALGGELTGVFSRWYMYVHRKLESKND